MKIAFGNDHAGLEMRAPLMDELRRRGHEIVDYGATSTDSVDYPDFARQVGESVTSGESDLGVVVCGTGIGISLAANKVKGVRSGVLHDEYDAQMAKAHNNLNVVAFRGREFDPELNRKLLGVFLDTDLDKANPRHQRRIEKVATMEKEND